MTPKKASRDARDLLTESVTGLLDSDSFKAASATERQLHRARLT